MSLPKKVLLWSGGSVLALTVALGVILLNSYLRAERRFVYATGTKDKAFLNATWKMSPREVERANNTSLSLDPKSFISLLGPNVVDKSRIAQYDQKNISLWGYDAEVNYGFFDNMLYEYYIGINVADSGAFKDVFGTLEQQFGPGKQRDDMMGDSFQAYKEWNTPKQKIFCWMTKDKDQKSGTYHIGANAIYTPYYNQIENIIKTEKGHYF